MTGQFHESPERQVYTPAEVCAVLGLSRSSVYLRLREGSIPHVRVGRRILIPKSALAEMLLGDLNDSESDIRDDRLN